MIDIKLYIFNNFSKIYLILYMDLYILRRDFRIKDNTCLI